MVTHCPNTTVCIVLDIADSEWIKKYYTQYHNKENIIIFAPTFDSNLILQSLSLEYQSFHQLLEKLDYRKIFCAAKHKSWNWKNIANQDNVFNDLITQISDYPLVEMHQSLFLLSLWEIIEAWEFTSQVLTRLNPDKIVIGQRGNPFDLTQGRLFTLVGSNGVEREAAIAFAKGNNIEITEIDLIKSNENVLKSSAAQLHKGIKTTVHKINKVVKDPSLIINRVKRHRIFRYYFIFSQQAKIRNWNKEEEKKCILFFVSGGYYIDSLLPVLEELLKLKSYNIAVALIGGELLPSQATFLQQKNILVFNKNHYENEIQKLPSNLNNSLKKIINRLHQMKALKSYFSDHLGSYFEPLVFNALKREFLSFPATIKSLLITEKILNEFNPDLVFAHFSIHAQEACDILPARVRGIPTLSMPHGFSGWSNDARSTFSTEYYAAPSTAHKKNLLRLIKGTPEKIFVTGNARADCIKINLSRKDAKKNSNLDENKPVCIFCDNTGWLQTNEWRHTTLRTLQEVVLLTKKFPELQIIYRVHHEASYSCLAEYIQSLHIKNLIFQVSPKPLFTEIVQASDFVIAHHTSAITESLLMGVPVIYLCALSQKDEMYFTYQSEVLKIANHFEELSALVRDYLRKAYSREFVLEKAQLFFESTVYNENHESPASCLAKAMIELLEIPEEKKVYGYQDWLDKINYSCSMGL